jgi:hypothetical protein
LSHLGQLYRSHSRSIVVIHSVENCAAGAN